MDKLAIRQAIRLSLVFVIFAVIVPAITIRAQTDQRNVYIISIEGEITPAMASFLSTGIEEANREGAQGIIIEISTLGGQVVSAISMRDAIIDSVVPVVIYIDSRAISAGALITIACDTIIMAPGSHLGSAEPVPNEPKALAYVSGEFRTTAERTGRDPEIAAAMVDKSIEIEGLVGQGQILDLTASEAYRYGYSDYIAKGRSEVLKALAWEDAYIIEREPDFKFRVAQFLTSYEVASILLMVGIIAFIAELFIPGFGVAGIIGITCFALYFAGGFLAGHTEWWSVLVFIIGLILIAIEIIVPGFGIFGITGIIALLAGVVFAAPTLSQGIGSLLIALAAAIIALILFFKIFGRAKLIQRFVLSNAETTASGFIHAEPQNDLLGKTGVTRTVLRPAGIVTIEGMRIDALAEGDYIDQGIPVKVVKVVGTKVVVAMIDKKVT